MSHAVTIQGKVTDLDALGTAAQRRGLVLDRTATTAIGEYGQARPCEGKIRLSDDVLATRVNATQAGEIALRKTADGAFEFVYDADILYYDALLKERCGGHALDKLLEEYGYAVAEAQAYNDGYMVERVAEVDGSITLVARRG